MAPYTEDDLVDAIFDVTDNGSSVHKASQKYNIPALTISARMNGVNKTKSEGYYAKQRLTSDQEERLAEWILRQESLGHAPSHVAVRSIAAKLLRQKGDYNKLGKKWLEGFRSRNPSIHTKIGRRIEVVRFNGFTPKTVNWYFNIREDYSWVKPEYTVNVDKGGIMAGFGRSLTSYKHL